MIITFGKYKGWDTEDLAKAGEQGRNYLHWGSSNLRSPKFAREFDRVLGLPVEYNEALMVKAIVEAENIHPDDALVYAREELEGVAEDNAVEDKMEKAGEALLAEYAPKMSTTANKLRGLAHKFQWNWEGHLSAHQFSSQSNFNNFVEFMTKWDDR